MTSTPRIRAFLPGRVRLSAGHLPLALPSSRRAGQAPQVFREFGQTLGARLGRPERSTAPRPPPGAGA